MSTNTQDGQLDSVAQLLRLVRYYWKHDLGQATDFSGYVSAEDFEERQVHGPAACQQAQAAAWLIGKLVLA